MTRVLITGANGHIGCHVVRAVAARGWSPIAFVRPGSDRRGLAGLDLEVREGDLLDGASLRRAMEGVELVMHVGAAHRNFARDPDTIVRPAVEGTKNTLEAARDARVRRVVYTSTGATVGFGLDPARPLDESHFLTSAKAAYVRGKIEAERFARDFASRGGPEVVILNPTGVFGPRDWRLTPATRAVIGLLQGDPAFLALCPTHVEDVADAHILAADKGQPGERYLIAGPVLLNHALADLVGELGGKRPATFRPPRFLLRFVVGLAEKKAAREGTDAAASRDAVDDLGAGHLVYDNRRSREVLGMTYQPARRVFLDAFRWLLHVHALKPKVEARVRRTLGAEAAPDPAWG